MKTSNHILIGIPHFIDRRNAQKDQGSQQRTPLTCSNGTMEVTQPFSPRLNKGYLLSMYGSPVAYMAAMSVLLWLYKPFRRLARNFVPLSQH